MRAARAGRLAPLLAALALHGATAAAQRADTAIAREIVPGVTLHEVRRAAGPWVLRALAVDLRRPELVVRGTRACDRLLGRERPSAIARRLRGEGTDVVGVLNADFFDLRGGTGASENNVVIDGEIVQGVTLTRSPFDTFDNAHAQLGMTAAGAPVLERFRLTGTVRTPGGEWPLAAINAPAPYGVALFTRWADPLVIADTAGAGTVEVALAPAGTRGDTVRYRVRGAPHFGETMRAPGGAALRAAGAARGAIAALRAGDPVTVVAGFAPRRGSPRTVVGGWPRIVQAGRNVALDADSAEGTFPRFSRARHPRSAVGFSRDSLTLYLVAVDGRRRESVGMTLSELAEAMIALGAHEALNFDGGGSTALVVRDSLVNAPSDSTGERPVGSVVVVLRDGRRAARHRVPVGPGRVATCVAPAPGVRAR